MTREITNNEDVIDSRDVISRIEELEETEDRDDQESNELKTLQELHKQGEAYGSDWGGGAGLIRESYFTTHAEELATDIGAISGNDAWPANCIDWDQAAEQLKVDYCLIDFDGVDYWVR